MVSASNSPLSAPQAVTPLDKEVKNDGSVTQSTQGVTSASTSALSNPQAVVPLDEEVKNDSSAAQSTQGVVSTSSSALSTSQAVTPIKKGAALAQLTQAAAPASSSSPATDSAYNASEPATVQPGSSQTLGSCLASAIVKSKRSSRFRRWIALGLNARNCVAPSDLQPATELVPSSGTSLAVADTQKALSTSVSQAKQSSQPKTPAVAGAQAIPLDTQQSQSSSAIEAPQHEASPASDAGIQAVPADVQPSKSSPNTQAETTPQSEASATEVTQPAQVDKQQSQSSPDTQAKTTPQSESPATKGTQLAQAGQQQPQSSPEPQSDTNTGQEAPVAGAVQQTPAASLLVTPASSTPALLVQGQTVPTNGQAITINKQPVRQSAGSIYIGSSAYPTPELAGPSSVAPSHLVAGELTFVPATPTPTPAAATSPVVLGGLTFSAEHLKAPAFTGIAVAQTEARPVVVGGQTYAPINQQGGNVENVQPEAQDQSSGGSQAADASLKPVVIAGQTYTPVSANPTPEPNSGGSQVFSFEGKAVTQGGPPVTIGGTRYSLGNAAVVVGTSTIPLTSGLPIPSDVAAASVLTVGSHKLTALSGSNGGFEIDNSSLLPGSSAIVVGGLTYSLNSASALIVGTSTVVLATAAPGQSSNEALTAGGETFTPLGSTAVMVHNTTLSVGGAAATKDGRVISLGSAGLVVGSSTFHYAAPVSVSATTSVESSVPASTLATSSLGLNSTMLSAFSSGSPSASASPTTPSLITSSPTGSSRSAAARNIIASKMIMTLSVAFMSIIMWVERL